MVLLSPLACIHPFRLTHMHTQPRVTHKITHRHGRAQWHAETHIVHLACLPPTSPLCLTQHPWSFASRVVSCQSDRAWGVWHVTPWDRIKCVIISSNRKKQQKTKKKTKRWETLFCNISLFLSVISQPALGFFLSSLILSSMPKI